MNVVVVRPIGAPAMRYASPQLQLETLFVLDEQGRIHSTREPNPGPGEAFVLIRGRTEVAWAVHASLAEDAASKVGVLARQETPVESWDRPPVHAAQYQALLGRSVDGGPAYQFPPSFTNSERLPDIHDELVLQKYFKGWATGEIEAGAAPMLAVLADGDPVSVCFCARRSPVAAEAGVETAPAFRGRGYAPRVVSAWAAAVLASRRVPLYSTSWANMPSQRVAAKLGLEVYAVVSSIGFNATG